MTPAPKTLNVSFTPQLTRFISSRAASGRCRSASEVVGPASRRLERDEAGLLPESLAEPPEAEGEQARDG